MEPSAAPIIYINAWPGTGKETIARLLEKQYPGKIRVVRNHLHIDLAEAVSTRESPGYQSVRKALRSVIFTAIAAKENLDYIYIFTDFQSDNELGSSVAKEYQEGAKLRGSKLISITLVCDEAENERRIQSEERKALVKGGSGKLLDLAILRGMRTRHDLFRFDESVEQIQVDVTARQAEDAARIIAAHLKL